MVCQQHPNSSVLIVGLTRESIKRIYIKDVLHVLNDKYRLGATFNRTELSMNFPNGSVLYLVGADSDESEMLKLLGQKFRLVIIDESSMYTNIDQRELVYAILKPAVADYRGTIAMIGTPSNYTNSLFYDITTGVEGGWSVHKWSALDNPHVRDNVQEDIDFLKQAQPGVEHTPRFKQHWLGEWYVDRDAMVYKYDPVKNSAPTLPKDAIYHYVLGVDLGYEDATSFVVGAYSYHDPKLYIVYTHKQKHMLLTDVAEKIASLRDSYEIHNIIVDGASKQAVEEIKQRYALPIQATEKQHKRDFIELMNTDLQTAKICLLPGNEELIEEWENLIWDEKQRKAGNWIESATCENHAADAALYMWRWSYNYVSRPKPAVKTEEEKLEDWWDAEGQIIENEKESDGWMKF